MLAKPPAGVVLDGSKTPFRKNLPQPEIQLMLIEH